jgi:glucose-1-phosphate thymidylyltransferase
LLFLRETINYALILGKGVLLKVIIPVAGIGTRLRPHTHTEPKALLYVAGKPLLGHILDSLEEIEFEEVVFVIGFLGDKIIEYVQSNFKFKTSFIKQEEILGLGYAIDLAIKPDETQDLLIILGDTIVETSWNDMIGCDKNLLGIKTVDDPGRFGVAEVNGDKIVKLWEKPENPPSNLALVGVYYIKDTPLFKSCLTDVINSNIKTNNEYQITDALQLMLEKDAEMFTYPIEGWYDCGKSETLLETNRHLLENYKECNPSLDGSVIIPPVFIDKTAIITNSIIGPYASIAPNTIISNSIITNSIVSFAARVECGLLKDSLIGNHANVRGNYRKLNVGDSSEIGY